MPKILLVEDDQSFARSLREWLEGENHVLDHAACISEAEDFLSSYRYDVLILDWELPDGAGSALCQRLTSAGKTTPILMLTGRSDTKDRVFGLNAGAFDYVCKPCFPEEISARIRAILRRGESSSTVIESGETKLDISLHSVAVGGNELRLSPAEFEILQVLVRNPGIVLGPDSIVARCTSLHAKVSRSAIKVHISSIKKKYASVGQECPLQWSDDGYIWKA